MAGSASVDQEIEIRGGTHGSPHDRQAAHKLRDGKFELADQDAGGGGGGKHRGGPARPPTGGGKCGLADKGRGGRGGENPGGARRGPPGGGGVGQQTGFSPPPPRRVLI